MTRPTYKNYTQSDLGDALADIVMTPMTELEADKRWAELQTTEEWANLVSEPHLKFLERLNQKNIAEEVSLFRKERMIGRRGEP